MTAAEIRRAYAAGADSPEAIGRATGATTGCGGCRGEVTRLLTTMEREREREVA